MEDTIIYRTQMLSYFPKIQKRLDRIGATLLEFKQYEHPGDYFLFAVISKRNRVDANWNQETDSRSYTVHTYNVQDNGLYYGHYDLNLELAVQRYREKYHSKYKEVDGI